MVYSHSAPPRDLRPAGIQKFLLEEERTGDWGGVVAIMVFWGGGDWSWFGLRDKRALFCVLQDGRMGGWLVYWSSGLCGVV